MVDARAKWLTDRRRYVTGSSLAPILGVASPVGTGFDVWADKVHGYEVDETEPMRLGRMAEPLIGDLFRDATGRHIEPWPAYHLAGARGGRVWASTLDFLTADPAPVECKLVGWAKLWADGPPPHVICQLQVQIDCLGATHGFIAALMGTAFKWWRVERDQVFIRRAKLASRRWWARHVTSGVMPNLDGRPEVGRILARLARPQVTHQAISLPAVADTVARDCQSARATRKAADIWATFGANQLRALLGRAAYGVTSEGAIVSHRGGQIRFPERLPREVHPPSPWSSDARI